MRLTLKIDAQDSSSMARATTMTCRGKIVETPVFMPVATNGSIRGQRLETAIENEFPILLANTYHLLLRPGPKLVEKFGGLHSFIKWPNLILTDSGGFQIFSLPNARTLSNGGASFRSYIDGRLLELTPESCIAAQESFGSDIMMVLDVCEPSTVDYSRAKVAWDVTANWAIRSLQARTELGGALFAIVQGALHRNLRIESADFLTQQPFDGFAIGGLAVGESKEERQDTTAYVTPLLPSDKPRYLMGVGTPLDILEAVYRGVDMFDCILPAALAQQGVAYTSLGKVDFRRGVYRDQDVALDRECTCSTCREFSRAYLHHLIKSAEVRGCLLIGAHNLHFYKNLTQAIRTSILGGSFSSFYLKQRAVLGLVDIENPSLHPKPGSLDKSTKSKKDTSSQTLTSFNQDSSTRRYKVVTRSDLEGITYSTVADRNSGEVMHSVSNPMLESTELYVKQTGLAERIKCHPEKPVVIWDVGLGAGMNASAAIRCAMDCHDSNRSERLCIYSFEQTLEPAKLVLENRDKFDSILIEPLEILIKEKCWENENIAWHLLEGDFLIEMLTTPIPDLIFYDPFSYLVDRDMWTFEAFLKLFDRVRDKSGCTLVTYSASTAVRAALLAAGFNVGYGVGTGPKQTTTIATVGIVSGIRYLGAEWLKRWRRSSNPIPKILSAVTSCQFSELVVKHPLFENIT